MSSWIRWNPNPGGKRVGDCTVRAIAAALDVSWRTAYILLSARGFDEYDMPSSDAIWGSVLRRFGFTRHTVPHDCPACYSAEEFARTHPFGIYVLGFGGHVATVRSGRIIDSWDSQDEILKFYWYKED